MNNTTRRVFFMQVAAGTSVLAATQAMAQAPALTVLNPTDQAAAGLGYAADTTKVDAKKYPKHTKEQNCSNCALYVTATGGCPLFTGKKVAALGWCSAWVKKAG